MKGKHPNPQIEKMFPPKQYLPGSSESLPTIKSRKLALKTYVREISKIEDVSSSLEFLATFNVCFFLKRELLSNRFLLYPKLFKSSLEN